MTEEKLIELFKKGETEEIVRILTVESIALCHSTEKGAPRVLLLTAEFEPAYNVLIHLVLTSKSVATLLPQIITNLSTPPSFPHGPSVSVAVLSTIFNTIPEHPSLRFQVFRTILSISQNHNLYDYISPYFKSVNEWLDEWKVTGDERTQVWTIILTMAEKAQDRYNSKDVIDAVNCISY